MARPGSCSLEHACTSIYEIDRVLSLSKNGISQLSRSSDLILAVSDLQVSQGRLDPEKATLNSERAVKEAELAKDEISKDFPVLHSHAVVALWGVLEVTIEDAVLEFLDFEDSFLTNPKLLSIKIPLSEYEQLDRTDRIRFLMSEYSRNAKADLKLGVARFETLLDLVGLSGGVGDDMRRNIMEYQQIRNVIVHRAGRADRRLVDRCPWLDLNVGDLLAVSYEQYKKYFDSVNKYLLELITRFFISTGLTREQAEKRLCFGGDGEISTE